MYTLTVLYTLMKTRECNCAMMWSDKHRPAKISQMVGNEEARAAVADWLKKWTPGTKPVLVVGPPGTGKTTLAFALAGEFGYDMIGLNASDTRSKSKLLELLVPVMENRGVMGRPTMIFIDEVDGLHGRSDYGGASALADLLGRSQVPVMLAANDDTADKLKPILKVSTLVRFRRVAPRLLRAYLGHVLRAEDDGTDQSPARKLTYALLYKTINRSKGDMRSMLNLAQSYSSGFNPQTETPADALTSEQAVPAFFKAESADKALEVLWQMPSDPREKIGAFYSSIVTSCGKMPPEKTAALLEIISEADILHGRIMRTQNWKLMRYLDAMLLRLYAAARSDDMGKKGADLHVEYSQYNLPWPLLTRIRFDGAKIRALASDMASALHVSASAFGAVYMPYMLHCIRAGSLKMSDAGDKTDGHGEIVSKEAQRLARV